MYIELGERIQSIPEYVILRSLQLHTYRMTQEWKHRIAYIGVRTQIA